MTLGLIFRYRLSFLIMFDLEKKQFVKSVAIFSSIFNSLILLSSEDHILPIEESVKLLFYKPSSSKFFHLHLQTMLRCSSFKSQLAEWKQKYWKKSMPKCPISLWLCFSLRFWTNFKNLSYKSFTKLESLKVREFVKTNVTESQNNFLIELIAQPKTLKFFPSDVFF